ncbi:MAG: hypothetical protein QM811_01175 [Pirellulales bacterium]
MASSVTSARTKQILLEGLRRLEYRGYDSAGIAVERGTGELQVVKAVGRIDNLAARATQFSTTGTTGVGHTRWATHSAQTTSTATRIGGAKARWSCATTA